MCQEFLEKLKVPQKAMWRDGVMPAQMSVTPGSIESIVFGAQKLDYDESEIDEVNVTVDAIDPTIALKDEAMEP